MAGARPIATTDEAALIDHLHALGLEPGLDLVVHTSLMAFGRLVGGPETVYRALRAVVGDEATLVVPTYTFQCSPETPYDPAVTPGHNVGVFSEYVRQRPGVRRSLSPIHNHAAEGPKAHLLDATPPTTSLGAESDFERLHQAGFEVLLLGVGWTRGCTFLHHMEAVAEVPYRTWLELDRVVVIDGEPQPVKTRYFARAEDPQGRRWQARFEAVAAPLAQAGQVVSARAPYGQSHRVKLTELAHCAGRMLAEDPYALVQETT